MMKAAAIVAATLACVLAACGKEAPKADAAAERAQALERSRQGAFGTQVEALDKAKSLEADVNRRAAEALEKAEKDAR